MTNQVRFLGLGTGLLALSLVTALLTPQTFVPGNHGAVLAVWVEHASFWIGILCVAAHLLQVVLADRGTDG